MSGSSLKGRINGSGEAEEEEEQLHVLAVDDCGIQRRVIEALLKNSSYKGIINIIHFVHSYYIFILIIGSIHSWF